MKKLVCLVMLLVLVGATWLTHSWLLDGIDGAMLSAIVDDDTVYAPQYSDVKFRQVTIAAQEQEVLRILGQPLEAGTYEGATILRYAQSAHDSSYHVRVVVLRDGRVAKKVHEFYVD